MKAEDLCNSLQDKSKLQSISQTLKEAGIDQIPREQACKQLGTAFIEHSKLKKDTLFKLTEEKSADSLLSLVYLIVITVISAINFDQIINLFDSYIWKGLVLVTVITLLVTITKALLPNSWKIRLRDYLGITQTLEYSVPKNYLPLLTKNDSLAEFLKKTSCKLPSDTEIFVCRLRRTSWFFVEVKTQTVHDDDRAIICIGQLDKEEMSASPVTA